MAPGMTMRSWHEVPKLEQNSLLQVSRIRTPDHDETEDSEQLSNLQIKENQRHRERVFELRTKIPGSDSTDAHPLCVINDSICDLCFSFLEFCLSRHRSMMGRAGSRFMWKRAEDDDYRWALFRHYTTVRMLKASVRAGCQLCCKMLDCTQPEEDDQIAFAFSGEPVPDDRKPGKRESDWYTFMICAVRSLATDFTGKNGFVFELTLAKNVRDCLQMPFEGPRTLQRCPSLSPISKECFEQIIRWRNDCVRQHQGCARKDLRLPLRLLDLGLDFDTPDSPSDGDSIRLVSTSGLQDSADRVRYVALSYCWGNRSENAIKTSDLTSLANGTSVLDLPATVRDAIYICRRCRIRYLWVDAYCICQDDKEE